MKSPPRYPDYQSAVPPSKKRWGVAWLVGNLLCVFCTLWLWPADKPTHTVQFWFWIAGFPVLFIGLLFAARSLIYQVALGNQQAYRDVMQQAEEQWWQQRSQGLPIVPWCLLGPVGDKPEHHLAALAQQAPPPKPVITPQGARVLRCPQILENDISRRGPALVRHLVRTLLDAYPSDAADRPIFQALYWCGTPENGQLFMQALSDHGWQFQQSLLPLNDIEQLDEAINHYQRLSVNDKKARLLCAGIYLSEHDESTQVRGEAGFVWGVGGESKVVVQRAERQDTSEETAQMLTQQVMKLAHLTSVPEKCLSLNQSAAEFLQSGGWPTLEQIQEPSWGDLQQISPFVAISMAAIQSQETEQPCGWITQDKEHQRIIGVTTFG